METYMKTEQKTLCRMWVEGPTCSARPAAATSASGQQCIARAHRESVQLRTK